MRHGAHGDRWLLLAMAACLALLGTLLWQSIGSAREHYAVARQVLSDYAELAAANYARELKRNIGFRVVHQVGQVIGRAPDAVRRKLTESLADDRLDPGLRASLAAVRGVWLWDPERRDLRCLYGRCELFSAEWLAQHTAIELPPEGFKVLHRELAGGVETAALYPAGSGQWIGNELDSRQLVGQYRDIAETAELLPAALTSRTETTHLALQLLAPSGRVVFDSGWPAAAVATGTSLGDDDYGGLFEGFTVRAGLDLESASDLIIGGLPRSRLPLLVLLMALTLGLMLAVFRLFWREHQLSRLRSDFVARVSHELRTPLTQIRMFAETLLLGRERDAQTSRLYLQIIDREARRLGQLVDNVLRFSRRQAVGEGLAMGRRLVRPLLEEIVETFKPLAAGAGSRIELKVSGDPAACIDDEAFRQIILNLLDNACKYGPEDQTVRVEAEQSGDEVRVRVCDQGPGIPEADRDRVWRAFERLPRDERRARHGTGIGLAVSGELLAAMGAQYSVRTGEGGRGTVVEMVLVAEESTDVVSHTAG